MNIHISISTGRQLDGLISGLYLVHAILYKQLDLNYPWTFNRYLNLLFVLIVQPPIHSIYLMALYPHQPFHNLSSILFIKVLHLQYSHFFQLAICFSLCNLYLFIGTISLLLHLLLIFNNTTNWSLFVVLMLFLSIFF